MEIEHIILNNLQSNEDYMRKVLPFLKDDYFLEPSEKKYFTIVRDYIDNYNSLPKQAAIEIEIDKLKINDKEITEIYDLHGLLHNKDYSTNSLEWLLNETESFCKNKSLFLALVQSMQIAEGENNQLTTTAIPDILSDALSVSFDTNIGHDYIDDADERFAFYHQKINRVPFHIELFNDITGGGVEYKTLNCLAAGTGIGKSAVMCDLAANYIKAGYNVLYITNEMAEEKLAKRIDANLMNVPIGDIDNIDQKSWNNKIETLKTTCKGRLKFKEYPPGASHTGHYRYLLKELKLKKNFIPQIVFIDYLNICASSRLKNRADMYMYVKSIAEELRALAVEYNLIVWTATQLNRSGTNNSEVELDNISESMGGPMTFDLLVALIVTEDLAKLGQLKVKQLKNRYGDVFFKNQFIVGYDKPKMRLYDLNNSSPTIVPNSNTANMISKARHGGIGVLANKNINKKRS